MKTRYGFAFKFSTFDTQDEAIKYLIGLMTEDELMSDEINVVEISGMVSLKELIVAGRNALEKGARDVH
jgi:hypothetical protein